MGLVWALWNFVKIRWQLYVHPGYIHTFRLFWFWLTANSESCRGHCSRWVMCLVIPWTWQITCIWTAVRKQSSFVFAGKRKLVFSGRRSKYLIEKQQFCFHCVCYQVDGGHVWLSIVKEITGPLYFKQPPVYTKLKAGVIQECSENEADKMHCGHARNSDCQRCWFLQLTLTHISQPAYRYSSRALLFSAVTSQNLAPCTSQWAHYGGRGVGHQYPAWPPCQELAVTSYN